MAFEVLDATLTYLFDFVFWVSVVYLSIEFGLHVRKQQKEHNGALSKLPTTSLEYSMKLPSVVGGELFPDEDSSASLNLWQDSQRWSLYPNQGNRAVNPTEIATNVLSSSLAKRGFAENKRPIEQEIVLSLKDIKSYVLTVATVIG